MSLEQEQDFEMRSILFDKKRKQFYENLTKDNIKGAMYVFGVSLRSYHHKYKSFDIVKPYASTYKSLWDIDIWMRVTWGADDETEDEVYEQEFDEGLDQMPYFDYLISKAVQYNRPAWAIFGLLGMMQGRLNHNAYSVEQHERFTKKDFMRCLDYLKKDFIEENKKALVYLFDYFDERNYQLLLESENIRISEK